MTRDKVISRIKHLSYSNDTLYFYICDNPKRLHYINCPIEFFDIIDDTSEYLLWKFTYSRSSHKIYKLRPFKDGYIKI